MLPAISKNGHTFCHLIEKCLSTGDLKLCKLLHGNLVKTSLNLDTFLANRLVDIYAKCNSLPCAQSTFDEIPSKNVYSWNAMLSAYMKTGLVGEARHLFDKMPQPNLVTWNSIISGLAQQGCYAEAVDFFRRMQRENRGPAIDNFGFTSFVNICAILSALELVRQLHGVATKIGLELNLIAHNALVDAYGKCGDAITSRQLFDRMPERDVVSWTSMVVGYARSNQLDKACQIFEEMPVKNAVSWTALIAGYTQNGLGDKALELFGRMQKAQIPPTAFTYVSILSACSSLALTEHGKQLHGHILKRTGSICNIFLANALIDMYAKCGDMNSATNLFDEIPQRDVISWNSLVTGFAQNGYGKQSLSVFERMVEVGIKPNHITFLGVLSACSHSGLVPEGRRFLQLMEREHSLSPRPEHYAVVVDMLGRNNCLEEAMDLINKVPCGSNVRMWGALLGACRVHGNLDLARRAAKPLLGLEPTNAARYVMLSNIYASAGRWDDVRQVRDLMKERGVKKEPAFSWIEVRNARHRFVAEDKSHDQIEEIYEMLVILAHQMKDSRCSPNNNFLFSDEEDGMVQL